MAKLQQLTFNKGLTNIPSDAICDDSSLEKSLNMVFDNGEHRPIQLPKEMGTLVGEPLVVHKTRSQDNYIILCHLGEDGNHPYYAVCYSTYEDGAFTTPTSIMTYEPNGKRPELDVTIIGNTLLFNTKNLYVNGGIQYYLWRADSGYKYLGDEIPFPQISFHTDVNLLRGNKFVSYADVDGILVFDSDRYKIDGEKNRENYNNLVIGLYEKNKKKIAKENGFCEPFFVRYAVELFDGTYTNISVPQLLMPNIKTNSYEQVTAFKLAYINTYYQYLYYNANFDLSEWSDIIKGVSVFATDGALLYDTTSDQPLTHGVEPNILQIERRKYQEKEVPYRDTDTAHYILLKKKSESEIIDEIKDLSVFYKIADLGYGYGRNVNIQVPIKSSVIENLTTQSQLPDDYFSHCKLSATDMTAYNQRVILSGVKRGFYEGATNIISWDGEISYDYTVCVYIDTPEGQRIVTNKYTSKERIDFYFFYPDPRAKKAEIYYYYDGKNYLLKTLELTEHPFLNGAYYINTSLPPASTGTSTGIEGTPPTENVTPENLRNQLWVSEVNNPFSFSAEGNVTIGNGNIITVSSITQALSQGQFGQYPLIVFSTDGIWACQTGSTGLFSAVHPMSREVCNSKASVTQTDGSVFFSSEKGLMVVNGSSVSCVSEQLNGKSSLPFAKFLKTAKIAYDYRDSLLWILNSSGVGFIYSIKQGTFSNITMDTDYGFSIINNYPDTLIAQRLSTSRDISYYKIFSLLNRPNINDDTNRYSGELVTRPLKLENALALKVINEIKNIYVMDGTITMTIYASNDLRQWYEITSTHGKPWKYFKFKFSFSSMKATDRFAGTVLETEERHTNKLR